MGNKQWTTEFPRTVGDYYFYGYDYKINDQARMIYVKVRQTSNGLLACIADGNLICDDEIFGLWLPIDQPEAPHRQLLDMMEAWLYPKEEL